MKTLKKLLGLALLLIVFVSCEKANSQEEEKGAGDDDCYCVKYLKNQLNITTGTAHAKFWGETYTPAGFSLVNSPAQVGDIMVIKPSLGDHWSKNPAFLDYGHVAIVENVVEKDTGFTVSLQGANQGPGSSDCGCSNMSIQTFTLPKNNLDDIRLLRSNAPNYECFNYGITPLDAPTLLSPANHSDIAHGTIMFDWSSVANGTSYRIQIASSDAPWSPDDGFTTSNDLLLDVDNISQNTHQWNSLSNNTNYWWTVSAKVNGIATPFSSPFQFTTTSTTTETRIIQLLGDLNFGNVDVGSSAHKTLTIKNTGNSTLHISNIILPSVGGYGYSTNGSGSSFDILPNASKDVVVSFTPQSASSYNGTIVIYSDKTSGDNTINTYAHGNETNTKIINLYPGNGIHYYGTGVLVGITSTKDFIVKNTGNAILNVTSISYPHPVFTPNGSDNFSVAPNQSVTVSFDFTPTASGNYDGVITVNSDATGGTDTISVNNANGI